MAEQQDYIGLDWVKGEIENTLTEARQALEKHQEEPGTPAHLATSQAAFNQIHGALRMLQKGGATQLSLEMKLLCEALASQRIPHATLAMEVLLQSVLQLPAYLEKTVNSGSDRPLSILPLINELRELRGEDPLPEATFFYPDLSETIEPVDQVHLTRLESSGLNPLLRKIRQKYQVTLAGYLRDQNRTQQLKIMGKIFAKLQDLCWGAPIAPLWESCVALTEGLEKHAIEQNLAVANLLRELDYQIRHFIEQGAGFINTTPDDELFRGLLYCIATSNSEDDFTQALKSRYKLEETLAEASREQAETFIGIDAAGPVVEALNYELAGIKEALDLYLLSPEPDPLVLQNQLPVLNQVADTLTILGMESLRASLKQKITLIQAVIDTGKDAEEKLMDVAGTILQLESSLSQFAEGNLSEKSNKDSLLDEVYQAVITEARKTLDQTKDAIVDFVDSQNSPEFLQQIPELLHKVHGGLSMTPLNRASDLVQRCASYIRDGWIEGNRSPVELDLEQLADTVTSIEYYLERLSDKGHDEVDAILDVAEESLTALLGDADISTPQQQSEQAFLEGTAAILPETSQTEPTQPDASAPVSVTLANRGVESQPYEVVEFEFSSESSLIQPEVKPEKPSETVQQLIEPEEDSIIDSELLEVFIEEAREVHEQLAFNVPQWLMDQEDKAVLKDVRRAFHTLKGSGRMVEANVVAELAWSTENMLNRLIDGTIEPTSSLKNLVDRVTQMLPALIQDFASQNQQLTPEVLLCMEQADALAKGEEYTVPESIVAEQVEAAPEATAEPEADNEVVELAAELSAESEFTDDEIISLSEQINLETETRPAASLESEAEAETDVEAELSEEAEVDAEVEAEYDAQLLEIFLGEAQIHVNGVTEYVEHVKLRDSKLQISDQVQRTLHTLKGITLMAEIEPLSRVIVPLEKNIKDFRAQLIPADDRVIRMLEEGLKLIQSGLDQLTESPVKPELDSEAYISWLEALFAQLVTEQQKLQASSRPTNVGQKTDLFVTGDISILLDADDYLSRWRESLSIEEVKLYRNELTTLAERSSDARLHTISELCDVLIDVLNYLEKHEARLPGPLAAPLSNGFEALVDMMNQVAAQQTPVPPQSVFSELRKSLETLLLQDDSEESAPVQEIEESVTLEVEDDQWLAEIEEEVAAVELEEIVLETEDDDPALAAELVAEALFEEPAAEVAIEEDIVLEAPTPVEEASAPEPEVTALPLATRQEATSLQAAPLNVEVEEHSDDELIELFLEEATELSEDCGHALEAWLNNRNDLSPLNEMQRSLHTLKGGARMADQPEIGDLSHALEDIYESISNGRHSADSAPLGLLQKSHDHIDAMIQAIRNRQPLPNPEAFIEQLEQWSLNNEVEDTRPPLESTDEPIEVLPDYLGHSTTIQPVQKPEPLDVEQVLPVVKEEEAVNKPDVAAEAPATPAVTRIDTPVTQTLSKPNEMIRVPTQLLEQLINLSGESSINRGRIEQQILDVSQTLDEMGSTIVRVKEQLSRLDTETQAQIISTYEGEAGSNPDFDPLEMDQYSELTQLSRSLVESASDLQDLKEAIQDKNRDAETLLLQQSRTLIELQEKLMQARMVSFSRLLPRLRKITRQISSELNKPVKLNVVNAEGEMDRTMLERILAPLEHMLRNAIDHGIEATVEERLALGKPNTGSLELSISRDGADIVLELKDDGRGIDLEAVHAKALEKHLITPDDKLTDHEISQLILEPGFTTASSVTQISGRGVGLDVVNTEIRQLGGSIQINSEKSKGSQFKLRLPFTLSVNRALMVRVGESLYALPMQSIDGITTVFPEAMAEHYQSGRPLTYGGQEHKVLFLGELLGTSKPVIQSEQCPVVLVERGGQNVALHVDEVIGGREIITKSLGPQFAGLPGVNGATILGDGRVVIIIDPAALVRRYRTEQHYFNLDEKAEETVEAALKVLVVDDSVTVRKVTTRLLERQGFEVDSARDGVEAMTKLAEHKPDIVLLDIEMPKMDGYEVASAIRNDPVLKSLPIIMITSRTGEKHKARAYSLGVNNYLGKPFQEATLLASIEELTQVQR